MAVVYLIPKDDDVTNQLTLVDLKDGILELMGKGRIVVMGDFNARVGELPNDLNSLDLQSVTPRCISRRSDDMTVNSAGRKVLSCLNGVGMILLNGVREKARFTSRQAMGNAVIDFVWVQAEDLKLI